ncbi:MAG: MOSC domain-containing protein [Lewinellaceae bacterium]|nr:MOSC domain-containing protein [Lewinellaceae bacterium]
MYTLSQINIFPVKSLGGISLPSAQVARRGLQYDRRWMLVDPDGRFVSQRELPEMALLTTSLSEGHLVVSRKNDPLDNVRIPLQPDVDSMMPLRVGIWSDRCGARLHESDINNWFSDRLKSPLRLVHMPETTRRRADGRYAPSGQFVSFADGYPFLLIGQASLDDLNNRLATPLPMDRFRPNFVFTGGHAFEEDGWGDFFIGDIPFRCVKPCARCIIPTIDQQTAQRAAEPLKTFATFRKRNNKILFGQNVIWTGEGDGRVHVGTNIKVAGESRKAAS